MSTSEAVEALRRYQAELSESKKHSVLRAIEDFLSDDREITITAVSRAAQVSREFVHSHEHLHDAVKRAANQAADRKSMMLASSETNLTQGLRADRATLAAHIDRLKEKIAEQQESLEEYKKLRKRWLGSQLPSGQRIDPEVHAELRVTNDKLMSENVIMLRQIAELRRLTTRLEGELAASRQAHADDVHAFGAADGTVVSIETLKSRK